MAFNSRDPLHTLYTAGLNFKKFVYSSSVQKLKSKFVVPLGIFLYQNSIPRNDQRFNI